MPGGSSNDGSGDDPLESSKPTRNPLPLSEHYRPTVRAPNIPLPPAAHQPRPVPRPELESVSGDDPTAVFPRPARLPEDGRARVKPRDPGPPPPPYDDGPPPIRRDDSRAFRASQLPGREDSRAFRLSQLPARDESRAFRLRELARRRPAGRPGEPSVLIVGAPETLSAALEPALARHRVQVVRAAVQEVADAVIALAPDLVVLAGDAARDSGHHILRALALSPQSSVVPVAILDDNTELEGRLRAFRHGAAAVIPRSASMDEMADRIATLAREIPERESETLGDVGEATLQELVGALEHELRTGILSVRAQGSTEGQAIRIVLGGGRALTETIDDFVSRVREHVVTAEPLTYEFDERAAGTVQLLGGLDDEQPEAHVDVKGLRVVLADGDAARADAIAQELRERGVDVVVTDLDPSEVRFHRIRTMDPAVLLIGEHEAQGEGYELMRRMRRDTRLRWASLLVVRWNEVWSEERAVPAIERILGTLSALAEPERALAERADSRAAFDTRLEITGPARMLRGLTSATKAVRVTIQNPRLRVRIDVSEGLVVGAAGEVLAPEPRELSGPVALAALMVVSSGRVHVEPTEQPQTTNLMTTPDVALNMADAEPPPIPPSMPMPAVSESRARRTSERPRTTTGARKRKSTSPLGTLLYALGGLLGVLAVGTVVVLAVGKSTGKKPAPLVPPTTTTAAPPAGTATTTATASATAKPAPAPPPKPEPEPTPEVADGLTTAPTCDKLLGPLPPSPGVYPGAAYDQIRGARKELARGDMNGAQAAYCKAIRFDPKNGEAHAGLARVLLNRRDAKAAISAAREAVKLSPEDQTAQILLGDALAMSGDLAKAVDPLLLGYGVTPSDAGARGKLVKAQLDRGAESLRKQDQVAAERAFRRALTLEPGRADAAAGLARALLEQAQLDAAKHWARKATALEPKSAAAWVTLGDALSKSGENSAAHAAWKRAVEVDPNDPAARARAMTAE